MNHAQTFRTSRLAIAILAACASAVHAQTPVAPTAAPIAPPPATKHAASPAATTPPGNDGASYDLGLIFGSQLNHGGLTGGVSMAALTRGIQDGLKGKQPTPQAKQDASQMLMGARQSLGERNKTLAHQFLAENGKRPGVSTTASGLQYSIIKHGDPKAKSPDENSQVTVAYRGTLLDGTEFDSSAAHGQAAIFRMSSIIPGWREALGLMTPGAKWRIFVPPELAYDNHSPPNIPPGSLLTFEIDLVKVSAAGDFSPQAGAAGHAAMSPPAAVVETAR